jgi:hypothetical protein
MLRKRIVPRALPTTNMRLADVDRQLPAYLVGAIVESF